MLDDEQGESFIDEADDGDHDDHDDHDEDADGIGLFDQWNIIVVPNHLPPARVREPDFPFSIFTRTRARTRRTEEHGSFPMCHFQSNAPFPKRQRRS